MVRLRKGIASRYWEDLVRELFMTITMRTARAYATLFAAQVLAIVGEQFDVGNEICGAVISIRYNEDIISLWNRNADNNEACYRIRYVLHSYPYCCVEAITGSVLMTVFGIR